MNILVVGNVLKDVYLNLDTRTEHLETDKNNVEWLDISFNASEHHFFNRDSNLGGAAVSLEVLQKMGLPASISDSDLHLENDGLISNLPPETYRYILLSDSKVSYFVPTEYKLTDFSPPAEPVDYLYIDRSAELTANAVAKINAYLDFSQNTKLILYVRSENNPNLNNLIPRADLVFLENHKKNSEKQTTTLSAKIPPEKLIHISDTTLSYQNILETVSIDQVDILTHLSMYSITAATILGGFILGDSVENSLKLARVNVENSHLNTVLSLSEMQEIINNTNPHENLELIAANLVLKNKGILAADESSESIRKKFAKLNIPDTYENRHDYRNMLFSTPNLERYLNGIILFDETAKQFADNGQSYINFLISKQIIPGIKVDQGLAKFENSLETYTKGIESLDQRLEEYHAMGLRFAKWRSAFEIRISTSGDILTPTLHAIEENCRTLAEYAKKCQSAGLVPVIEPEVVYDGFYSAEQNAEITGKILDVLFKNLSDSGVNLRACILKVNMILAGKNYKIQSTPKEVGQKTAEVLKEHVPPELAGVAFLSGGQTAEQATANLSEIEKNGPFSWPVTFSFARALQDPALFAWNGDNENISQAEQAFLEKLIANTKALQE